ncbi:hypothetical protein [Tardiphaga sp.]|uniref:hypothetical protein n=1 Tax=Tardiphaga sp. TaxID=1926292 RepID=UPI0037D9C87B
MIPKSGDRFSDQIMRGNGAPFSFLAVATLEHFRFVVAITLWRSNVAVFFVVIDRTRCCLVGCRLVGRRLGGLAPLSRIHPAPPHSRDASD